MTKSVNKQDLIDEISKMTDLTKADSQKALDAVMAVIVKSVSKGKRVSLVGFGTFESAKRKARTGVNPQTREPLKIPASKAPKFRPGKAFKDAVNK